MEKKKNPESVALANSTVDFIAPASFFRGMNLSKNPSEEIDAVKIETVSDTSYTPDEVPLIITNQEPIAIIDDDGIKEAPNPTEAITHTEILPSITAEETITAKKIDIKPSVKRVSALSISSLKAKKAHELKKNNNRVDEGQLPKETFAEETMQQHWADFVQKIDKEGRKILASNLHVDLPKLRDETTICIEMPNDTMKKEIEREQYDLLEYLKSKLNNHFISLNITVNEKTAKKFAFTPEEKYEKLREKNPAIDLLRKEFDLDL